MKQNMTCLTLGTCYYPEHWPESLWEDDMKRMLQHGITVIRIAEFAWSILEPEEGLFDYAFFDRFLDCAHACGMKVILGTPTATPPAWLTDRYPEVLNAEKDGTLLRHGMRRHYNYNSAVYRAFSARIVEKMASHYAAHPAVEGWQIDNELNCEINVFYSDADHKAFRAWLAAKYGTLENLNNAWGTTFWNQTYTEWSQVYLARPAASGSSNPHALLDEKRFISDSAISFCRMQRDILRRYIPENQYITTNGMFGHLDNHQMMRDCLDFYSYDSYPQFGNGSAARENGMYDRKWSMNLASVRSICPNFTVMEQQSGPGGWVTKHAMPSPKPGQMRLWTYQSVAHGANTISYFRWRTAHYGTEIYWHGLLNYDNRDNRRIAELDTIRDEFNAIGDLIAPTGYDAKVAVLRDYDNEFDAEEDRWVGPLVAQSEFAWFCALQHKHIPFDYVYTDHVGSVHDLDKYDLLIYPHPAILTEKTADLLKDFTKAGGKLIFGARTGYKDIHGQCPMAPMPGPAASLVGGIVNDFTLFGPFDPENSIRLQNGKTVPAACFADILLPVDCEVIGEFTDDYYAGSPAFIKKENAYYYGSAFTEEAASAIIDLFGITSPFESALPEDVELAVRADANSSYYFLLNYAAESLCIQMPDHCEDLLNNPVQDGQLTLPAYGVAVIRQV